MRLWLVKRAKEVVEDTGGATDDDVPPVHPDRVSSS
jgi:hypothetical protein